MCEITIFRRTYLDRRLHVPTKSICLTYLLKIENSTQWTDRPTDPVTLIGLDVLVRRVFLPSARKETTTDILRLYTLGIHAVQWATHRSVHEQMHLVVFTNSYYVVLGRWLSTRLRRPSASTPFVWLCDLRRPTYTDHLRRPVFCRCWSTSVELFANRTKTVWQSRTV